MMCDYCGMEGATDEAHGWDRRVLHNHPDCWEGLRKKIMDTPITPKMTKAPFNLEKALRGDPIVTALGDKAKIVYQDLSLNVGLIVEVGENSKRSLIKYDTRGWPFGSLSTFWHENNRLFMLVPEKRIVKKIVNIYRATAAEGWYAIITDGAFVGASRSIEVELDADEPFA